ncbi:hypothetical protein PGQ11_002586 [Apiospora arundinis]|uniref:Lysine-specific metallo-endopeptidase domain-containing protein n=1 Tax=Apiospora arundinis TaxID=335852 RepID=A0ABR2JIJ6_9PEZI
MQDHYDTDVHVQQMVKHILGDNSNLQAKIDVVQSVFSKVSQFDKTSFPFLGPPVQNNQDVFIFCDGSNYEPVTTVTGTQVRRNKVIGAIVANDHWENIKSCYDSQPSTGKTAMALTTRSDWWDQRGYEDEENIWEQRGRIDESPKREDFIRTRDLMPNTMDLCKWYLLEKQSQDWPRIDQETVERVRDEAFVSGLRNNDKAVDTLSTTLSATLLHELTHTNRGGGLEDKGDWNCYGWVCVGNLKDPTNADSVNMLGVVLKLWSMGYYVNSDGRVERIEV